MNNRKSYFPCHPKTGEPVLPEVYADPGRNGFYYREKMPDSVIRYVPADHTFDAIFETLLSVGETHHRFIRRTDAIEAIRQLLKGETP